MLVLTRRENERVMIGSDIVIDICKVDGKQVRIGITAPSEIKILREEIVLKNKKEG